MSSLVRHAGPKFNQLKTITMRYTINQWRTGLTVMLLALSCLTAGAQRHRRYYRPTRVTTVVSRPVVVARVNNRFNQRERLAMALAYLRSHAYLTVRQYARMTQLTKASAEAELDAFAADRVKPIQLVVNGKKKYTRRG